MMSQSQIPVTNRIFVWGEDCWIWRATSMPLSLGRPTSKRIRSGFSSCVFSMASIPSEASPTTSKPGICSMLVRRKSRNGEKSSTSRTRMESNQTRSSFNGSPIQSRLCFCARTFVAGALAASLHCARHEVVACEQAADCSQAINEAPGPNRGGSISQGISGTDQEFRPPQGDLASVPSSRSLRAAIGSRTG